MKSFKSYTEEIDQLLESIDDGIDQELLQEIALRTVSIGVFLAKAKQYANKIDTSAKQLRSTAQKLDDNDLKNCFTSIAELFYLQRKMLMYSTLTSASTGIRTDRNYKILQQLSKRK
jgi:hypothetical protein